MIKFSLKQKNYTLLEIYLIHYNQYKKFKKLNKWMKLIKTQED